MVEIEKEYRFIVVFFDQTLHFDKIKISIVISFL